MARSETGVAFGLARAWRRLDEAMSTWVSEDLVLEWPADHPARIAWEALTSEDRQWIIWVFLRAVPDGVWFELDEPVFDLTALAGFVESLQQRTAQALAPAASGGDWAVEVSVRFHRLDAYAAR